MSDCKVRQFAKSIYLKIFGLCRCHDTNPEQTRNRILEAAFTEMYENGFQGMRIEHILQKTGLAKGALYHHFPSKKSLGYAVVDEVLFTVKKQILQNLANAEDPIAAYAQILTDLDKQVVEDDVVRGCPLNNLSQEMCSLDEGFKDRLLAIHNYWQNTLETALVAGQANGTVDKRIDAKLISAFIISSHQGIVGTVKCMQSLELMHQLNATLRDYLYRLRPEH
ncbi:MAG TPA: TetR/AcrR family transcriptional regulator [Marinagarivorans sp.]